MSNQTDTQQVLQFVTQKIHVCVGLDRVERILSLVSLKPVPLSPRYVVGIMSLPGESVVVVDLAERLGLQDNRPYTIDTPILLCTNSAGRKTGLIATAISGVENVSKADIQLKPEFDEKNSPFVGIVNTSSGPSLQLNTDKILSFSIMDEEATLELEMTEDQLSLASR